MKTEDLEIKLELTKENIRFCYFVSVSQPAQTPATDGSASGMILTSTQNTK